MPSVLTVTPNRSNAIRVACPTAGNGRVQLLLDGSDQRIAKKWLRPAGRSVAFLRIERRNDCIEVLDE